MIKKCERRGVQLGYRCIIQDGQAEATEDRRKRERTEGDNRMGTGGEGEAITKSGSLTLSSLPKYPSKAMLLLGE